MKPRSLASSHTGRRGHDVRHASSTSAYGPGSQPIHSSRSRTKLSTLSDPGMWVTSSRRLSSAHYSRYDSGDMNARRPLQAASRRRGGVRERARRGCRQKLGKPPTAGSRVSLSPGNGVHPLAVASTKAPCAVKCVASRRRVRPETTPQRRFGRVGGRIRTGDPESGRPDSNRRTSATQTRRSTRLSYAPVGASMAAATMHGACRIVDAARAWAISLPRLRR
jgi:hypothetical protein